MREAGLVRSIIMGRLMFSVEAIKLVVACDENVDQSFSPEHHNGKILSSKNDWGSLLLNPDRADHEA